MKAPIVMCIACPFFDLASECGLQHGNRLNWMLCRAFNALSIHDWGLLHGNQPLIRAQTRDAITCGGRRVKEDFDAAVLLQETGSTVFTDRALDCARRDAGLRLAESHEQNPARAEDRGEAHRDRRSRHVALTEEIRSRVHTGHRVQRDEPRHAASRGTALQPDVNLSPTFHARVIHILDTTRFMHHHCWECCDLECALAVESAI